MEGSASVISSARVYVVGRVDAQASFVLHGTPQFVFAAPTSRLFHDLRCIVVHYLSACRRPAHAGGSSSRGCCRMSEPWLHRNIRGIKPTRSTTSSPKNDSGDSAVPRCVTQSIMEAFVMQPMYIVIDIWYHRPKISYHIHRLDPK